MPLDQNKQNGGQTQPGAQDEDALLEEILAEARALRARQAMEQLPDVPLSPEPSREETLPPATPEREEEARLSGKEIAAYLEKEIQEFVPPSVAVKQSGAKNPEPEEPAFLPQEQEPEKEPEPPASSPQREPAGARVTPEPQPSEPDEPEPFVQRDGLLSSVKKRLRRKQREEQPDPMMLQYGESLTASSRKEEAPPPAEQAPEKLQPPEEPLEAEEFVTVFQKIQKNRKPIQEGEHTRQLDRPGKRYASPAQESKEDTIRFTGLRDLKLRQQAASEKQDPSQELPADAPQGEEKAGVDPEEMELLKIFQRSKPAKPAPPAETGNRQKTEAPGPSKEKPPEESIKPPKAENQDSPSKDDSEPSSQGGTKALAEPVEKEAETADKEPAAKPEPDAQAMESPAECKPLEELLGEGAVEKEPEAQKEQKPRPSADTNTIEWDIFAPSPSKYEQHFGKLRPAKSGQTADEGAVSAQQPAAKKASHSRERHNAKQGMDLYRKGSGRVDLLVQGEQADKILRFECKAYDDSGPRPQQPAPKKPRPAPKKEPPKETLIGEAPEKAKGRFHIFGDAERDTEPDEAYQPDLEEVIDDYTGPEDAFSVKKEIASNVRRMFFRSLLMGILLFFSLALTVAQRVPVPAMQELFVSPYVYPGLTAGLLALSILCCHTPILGGLTALVRLRGNSDSGIAFAALAVLAGSVAAFFSPQLYQDGTANLYAPLVLIGLFLNSWGKFIMVRRVQLNFKFITSPDQKYAAKILNDPELSQRICKGMGNDLPLIAYQKKAGFLTNFLQLSYEPDPSERMAGKLAPFGALLSLLAGVASYLITKSVHSALATLAVCACVSVPVCCVPAVNLPVRRLCKLAHKKGAMLVGYPGVRQFADTNVVELDVRDLYPSGSVTMHGIKTFSGQRVDEAILEAAAVMCKIKSPMASTFDQIIQGKSSILPKVESITYEDDMGLLSWVNGRRVLLGNRRLLEEHGITPPTRDYEAKFTKDDRRVTYLAAAGDLMAMFVTSYRPDEGIMEEMQRLEDNGVSFVIRTCDPNLTAKMISEQFGVFFRSVKILPDRLGPVFDETEEEPHSTRAYLATRGAVTAMQRLVAGCIRIRSNITLSIVLQMIAVIFGFVLVAFLALYAGVGQLGTLEMVVYTLFWVLAVMIVPSFRKP